MIVRTLRFFGKPGVIEWCLFFAVLATMILAFVFGHPAGVQ